MLKTLVIAVVAAILAGGMVYIQIPDENEQSVAATTQYSEEFSSSVTHIASLEKEKRFWVIIPFSVLVAFSIIACSCTSNKEEGGLNYNHNGEAPL